MALHWFRKHQKRFLYPLTAVIAFTFIFVWGGDHDQTPDYGGDIAVLGGEVMSRTEYNNYRRVLFRLRYVLGVDDSEGAPFRYRSRAIMARRAGAAVSGEQLRRMIKMIMATPPWLGKELFTEREYLVALNEQQVGAADFETVLEDLLLGEVASEATAQAGHLTNEEAYLAYCRERDQVKLKVKDFAVKEFEKDAEAPTDEDLKAYYEKHKGDPADGEVALSTDPEVAIEYGFVDKASAVKLAKAFREAEPVAHVEQLLAGAPGALAGSVQVHAVAAAHEKALRDRYESVKKPRFLIPAKKEDAPAAPPAGAEGEKAAEEKDEPKEEFRPFDEVRAEVERDLDDADSRSAARRQAQRTGELVERWSLLRPVSADAFFSGLCVGVMPACSGMALAAEHLEFRSACAATGTTYGLTRRAKPAALKRQGVLGDLHGLADRAVGAARSGETAVSKWAASVENGAVAWRSAEYLAPRPLTFDEAKDTVVKRVVHARAARKAREAASKYRDGLEDGSIAGEDMAVGEPVAVRSARAQPFALLGIGEVPPEVVAVHAEYDGPVDEERPDEDLLVHQTGSYRVAIVVDRVSPTKDQFEGDASWQERSRPRLATIRRYFMADHWTDQVNDNVEYRLLQRIDEPRKHVHDDDAEE